MTGDALDAIVAKTRRRIEAGYYDRPGSPPPGRPPSLAASLRSATGGAMLVEWKPASPSRGPLRALGSGQAARFIDACSERRVAGFSVLTDPDSFGGSLTALRHAVEAAARHGLPVLMKDFALSKRQIDAARRHGAAAVLLIETLFERGLAEAPREELVAHAHAQGLEVLLEANGPRQYEAMLASGADVLAVNNRDLSTLAVDLATTQRTLAGGRRTERPVLALSGCETRRDVLRMLRAGADGVLVGTAVMAAADPVAKVEELLGSAGPGGRAWIKLCGMRTEEALSHAGGADAVGFVVGEPDSPRNLAPEEAAELAATAAPERVLVTTVRDAAWLAETAARLGVDAVQVHVGEETLAEAVRQALPSRLRLFAVLPLPGDGSATRRDVIAQAKALARHANALFLDAKAAHGRGGTGTRADWGLARAVRDALAPFPVVLAGGLSPENVSEALREVGPSGVDVSSGIESGPGVKSPERMRAFLAAARREVVA